MIGWMTELERATLDLEEYTRRAQQGPCFICRIIDGTEEVPHHVVYRDDSAIVFLNRYPTLLGYCLVAPLEHRPAVVGAFDESEYLGIQQVVYRAGRAITSVLPTERLYILSLGSNQGNAHVHWHVAPLPPGVPYEEQQFPSLMIETSGYLKMHPDHQEQLARRITTAMERA